MRSSGRGRGIRGLAAYAAALLGSAATVTAGGPEPRVWPVAEVRVVNVAGLAFAPDGRTLASTTLNGVTILWDLARRRPRALLKAAPGHEFRDVAFSPDGKIVATGDRVLGGTGTVRLWDAETGAPRRTAGTIGGGARGIAFSRDGRRVGAIGDPVATVWDVAGDRTPDELGLPEGSRPAAFGPDLATLVVAAGPRGVRLVDVATAREVADLGELPDALNQAAFSPDGKVLAVGTGDPHPWGGSGGMRMRASEGEVRVWDLGGGAPRLRGTWKGLGSAITGLAFAPDGGSLVIVTYGAGTVVLDVASGERRATLRGGPQALAISPDGATLAGASPVEGIALWDAATWAFAGTLRGRWASRIAYRPDGKTLAVTHDDGTVALRDAADGHVRLVLQAGGAPGDRVDALTVARDGSRIAAGLGRDGIALWDAATGTPSSYPSSFGLGPITAVALAGDGKALAAGESDGSIRLWGLEPQSAGPPLRGHEGRVVGLAFAPDGATLFSAGDDGTVRTWDVAARRERSSAPVHTVRMPRAKQEQVVIGGRTVLRSTPIPGAFDDRPVPLTRLALAPDGATLATADGGFARSDQISLRDAAAGTERKALTPAIKAPGGNPAQVTALAFSTDGARLAAGAGRSAVIYEVATGRELLTLDGPGWVLDLAFAPDGRSLAACGNDHIWVWDLPAP